MNKRIVYSTDGGRMCPDCGLPRADCRCKSIRPAAPTDSVVRLQRQVKGRKGKPVVVISGLPLDAPGLKALSKTLKSKCGVGGSVDNGNLIMQGDKRELIKSELQRLGFTVKISGG